MLQMIGDRLADQFTGLRAEHSRLAKLIEYRGVHGEFIRSGDLQARQDRLDGDAASSQIQNGTCATVYRSEAIPAAEALYEAYLEGRR